VQQHAREAVDPQHPVPQQQHNGHIINVDRPDEEEHGTAHTGSDEEGHGRVSHRIDQGELIKASTEEFTSFK